MEIQKIALVFMPNRFSQKLSSHNITKIYDNIKYKVVPFNFKKYSNVDTIKKRLSEYNNYIVVHETDIDIIEKLKELKIDFKIMNNQLKNYSIFVSHIKKLHYRYDTEYIIKELETLFGLKNYIYHYSFTMPNHFSSYLVDVNENYKINKTKNEAFDETIENYKEDMKKNLRNLYIVKNSYPEYYDKFNDDKFLNDLIKACNNLKGVD